LFSKLETAPRPDLSKRRPDDPRLDEVIEFWMGDENAFRIGRAVILGFPQDEGVLRNHGRAGAAQAPNAIRHWLYKLTPYDCLVDPKMKMLPPLDIGNLILPGDLEASQEALGEVVSAILKRGAIPIVLGGGHETAYGHYLGYVMADKAVAVINIDAHLDIRPTVDGQGTSGTAFRQALEHPMQPLAGNCYTCMGVQEQYASREHVRYAREHGCVIRWRTDEMGAISTSFREDATRLGATHPIYVSIDADVVRAADVPGVSAPNPVGLDGREVCACARFAGISPQVSSFDVVEINPAFDRDDQSARWAATLVWNFLIGLTLRRARTRPQSVI
jgi:formiminoglutamase